MYKEGIKNPGIMIVKKSRDFKISPGISQRDFFPSFFEILFEMLLNFLVLMENLALNTNEVFIFGHGNIIFSYFLKYFEKKTTIGSKMF